MSSNDIPVTVIMCFDREKDHKNMMWEFIVMETKSGDERLPTASEVAHVCQLIYGKNNVHVIENAQTILNNLPANIEAAIKAKRRGRKDLKVFEFNTWQANEYRKYNEELARQAQEKLGASSI